MIVVGVLLSLIVWTFCWAIMGSIVASAWAGILVGWLVLAVTVSGIVRMTDDGDQGDR